MPLNFHIHIYSWPLSSLRRFVALFGQSVRPSIPCLSPSHRCRFRMVSIWACIFYPCYWKFKFHSLTSSVCHDFLKGREVTLPCSQRSTCFCNCLPKWKTDTHYICFALPKNGHQRIGVCASLNCESALIYSYKTLRVENINCHHSQNLGAILQGQGGRLREGVQDPQCSFSILIKIN